MIQQLRKGLDSTVEFNRTKGFATDQKYQKIYGETNIDEFFLGDFASAFYTINVQLDSDRKEVFQMIVTARPLKVTVSGYGRVSTITKLVDIGATADISKCYITATPISSGFDGCKVVLTARYFNCIDPLQPPPPDVKTFDSDFGRFDTTKVTFDAEDI